MKAVTKKKVYDFIKENALLEKGDIIVAGVSGGADSMCMLRLLMELKEELALKIIVAHVDHGIRGLEAKADAEFVKDFCSLNNIIFEQANTNIPELAKSTGTSCEEAGRNFRYDFFKQTAVKYHSGKIAVAHNSGDNAETVMFNIFRGSGIGGLKGILPKRVLKDEKGNEFLLVRPILILNRSEIEGYLKNLGQEYRTDRTNLEEDYSRNRIRNSILPLIKENINSNVEGHIERLSFQAAETDDYLNTQADSVMHFVNLKDAGNDRKCEINCEGIAGLHSVIRKILIRRAFEMVSGRLKDVEEKHIREIDGLLFKQTGRKLSMPYGITARKEYGNIVLEKTAEKTATSGFDIGIEVMPRNELAGDIPRKKEEKWFDFDKIGSMPRVRTMKSGDYMIIGPKKQKKSLNRFMIDNKIPLSDRNNILLLAEGSHILWVAGYRQDESSLIDESTKRVLVAKIINTEKVK